jgi:hypothetical protein
MAAMPKLQIINVMSAGLSDADWPNEPKAHLMMVNLQENYVEATPLSIVGARQDLENCTLKKDENPKVLFERLTRFSLSTMAMHKNAQASVTKDELVAQEVPAVYNLTVAGLYETEVGKCCHSKCAEASCEQPLCNRNERKDRTQIERY